MTEASHLVLAHYHPAPGQHAAVLALLEELAVASRAEPGNRGYDYFLSPDGAAEILIVERYERAADFAAHRETEHFQDLAVRQIIPLLARRWIEEIPLG
ncbi:MAG TPA: antibiotic biosynthesis monooxygenase family protein [Flexivirga sp.]|uniref:putative quinol monooxygenase n=1 Tax=Flexivirga sp. TaxID=1962927 RepID=UPI002D103A32|nr:antibiotic biosynthesis monooxygenase family protein [Flexivirga sp.]HWC24662.1 antibiotic biosynthesis monooxygenase family protein [Flexivirga sp.]